MTTTLDKLKQTLPLVASVEAVQRSKQNCYAENSNGISALRLIGSDVTELILDDSAKAVTHLYLGENAKLKQVSFKIPLPNLEILYLNNCALTALHIPTSCVRLEQLYVQNNPLGTLSFGLNHPNLTLMDISGNQLTDLLPFLPFLKRGVEISYNKNPLSSPPAEIIERGDEAVLNYLEQFAEQGEDYLFEAKALILGKPRAGKTSLTLKIQNINNPLPKFEETTKGIDVYKWDFELTKTDIQHVLVGKTPEQQKRLQEKAERNGFRVNLWDFGGQEIYTATHQFFLSRRSLYMIVDAESKEDTNWYDWFYQVEKLGDKSPLLVILNKLAGRDWDIPDWGRFKSLFDFIKDKYPLNLAIQTDEDKKTYHKLIADIKRYLLSLSHIGDPLPSFWTEIRQQIAAELDKKKKNKEQPFITEDRFFQICQTFQEKDPRFGKQEQLVMSQYFHDIGIYLHFQDNDNLRNFLFLDANWTTDMVYMLLDDAIVRDYKKGRFDKKDIDRIWKEADYRAIKGQLMHLLRHFGLAFPIHEHKGEYLTPYHLSPEKPDYELPVKGLPFLELYYEFENFIPKGILPQLTVSLSEHITDINRVWRRGVVLQFKKHNTLCEIEETYTKEIHIRIYGTERKETLAIVMNEISKILNRFSKLAVEEMIPCNCSVCQGKAIQPNFKRTFFPYKSLKERLESTNADAHFVDCKHNGFKKMPIEPMLAEVFSEKEFGLLTHAKVKKELMSPSNEITSPNITIIDNTINPNPTTMKGINKNLIIGGIIAILILLLPIWKTQTGQVSILGLIEIAIGPKTETPPKVEPAPVSKKVFIKGKLLVNNTQVPSNKEITSVGISLKGVNPENLDAEGSFTFKVDPDKLEKEVKLEVIFADASFLPTGSRFIEAPDKDNYIYLPNLSVNKNPAFKPSSSSKMSDRFIINIINNAGDNNNNTINNR